MCRWAGAGPSVTIARWPRSSPRRSRTQPDGFSLPIRVVGRLEASEHPAPKGEFDADRLVVLAGAAVLATQQPRLVRVPSSSPGRLRPDRRMRMKREPRRLTAGGARCVWPQNPRRQFIDTNGPLSKLTAAVQSCAWERVFMPLTGPCRCEGACDRFAPSGAGAFPSLCEGKPDSCHGLPEAGDRGQRRSRARRSVQLHPHSRPTSSSSSRREPVTIDLTGLIKQQRSVMRHRRRWRKTTPVPAPSGLQCGARVNRPRASR